MRGELQRARGLNEQLHGIAHQSGSRVQLLWAHLLQGDLCCNRGDLTAVKSHLEQSFALYDPDRHNPRESNGRNDPGIACLASLVSTTWLLGYPDQARASMRQTLQLAAKLPDPLRQSFAYFAVTVFHQRCWEEPEQRPWEERPIALARGNGVSMRIARGMIYRGWSAAEQGKVEECIAQLEQGVQEILQTGAGLARLSYLASPADAYANAGRTPDALSVFVKGLATVEKNDDRFYVAEL